MKITEYSVANNTVVGYFMLEEGGVGGGLHTNVVHMSAREGTFRYFLGNGATCIKLISQKQFFILEISINNYTPWKSALLTTEMFPSYLTTQNRAEIKNMCQLSDI